MIDWGMIVYMVTGSVLVIAGMLVPAIIDRILRK